MFYGEWDKLEGSLKEIGAKPGDLVMLVHNGILAGSGFHDSVGRVGVVVAGDQGELRTEGYQMDRRDDIGHKFRIVSKDISDEEII